MLQPGPTNSIVDVAGMSVGHASVWRDEPAPPAGRGTARTGVSVIVPFTPAELFSNRVAAGAAISCLVVLRVVRWVVEPSTTSVIGGIGAG